MPVIDLKNTIVIISDDSNHTLEVKIGEGNFTWKETKPRQYIKDRGRLDTVRNGDEESVDVSFAFMWEWLKSVGIESVTVEDALKKIGAASDWVSTGEDPCAPYCVDITVENNNGCGDLPDEFIVFHEFRYEDLNHDIKAGTVAVTGKCNEVMPRIIGIFWSDLIFSDWDTFTWEEWNIL